MCILASVRKSSFLTLLCFVQFYVSVHYRTKALEAAVPKISYILIVYVQDVMRLIRAREFRKLVLADLNHEYVWKCY